MNTRPTIYAYSVHQLQQMIATPSSINASIYVNFNNKRMGDQGIYELLTLLPRLPEHSHLCLEGNNISEDGFKAVAHFLMSGECPAGMLFLLDRNQFSVMGKACLDVAYRIGQCEQAGIRYQYVSGLRKGIRHIEDKIIPAAAVEALLPEAERLLHCFYGARCG